MPFTDLPITQGHGENETKVHVIQGYIAYGEGGDFSIRAGLDPDGNFELVIYSEEIISGIRGVTTTDGATHRINYTPPKAG